MHRSESPYIWPPRLYRPSYDHTLVYLDLNHWIYLAQAATGHSQGPRYERALEVLREAKRSGRFLFVLSGAHYMEIAGITDPRQRRDIADVMEELSDFRTIVSRAGLIKLELEAALDQLIAPRAQPLYPEVRLLGNGVFHAFGMRGGIIFRNAEGEDVTAQARLEYPEGPDAFDRWKREAELQTERSLLRGPTDEEEAELRANGWRPEVARQIAEQRAEAEREQTERFNTEGGRWRRGRTRDVVAGRHLLIEMHQLLLEGLAARGADLESELDTPEKARRLTDSMPSSDIAITLMTALHRNPQTIWSANHIFDIDAMSVAVPYCDMISTERHACHTLKSARADRRAQARLFDHLSKLANAIEESLQRLQDDS